MKTRSTGFSGVITMFWCGLLLAAPLAAGAADTAGHGTGDGIAMSAPHAMSASERRLLESTLAQVSSLESYLVEIRTRGSEVEIVAAENSLRNAENLLISLMAQAADVPIATITTMHSSGVPYGRIGYDLGVFAHHTGSSVDSHGMVGAQVEDMTEIENMTMTDDMGVGQHTTDYHAGVAGNDSRVRNVVTVDYVAGDWDDHHDTVHGYGTSLPRGYSGYYSGYNHYNGGGMMGGMH